MPQLENLRRLMRLQSPSNLTSSGNSYLDKRRQQIALGEDDLAPSELTQHKIQQNLGSWGHGVSRDMIRDEGIQQLKQKLGLIQAEAQAKLQPEIIKGEYGVRQAREAAEAAEAKRAANEQAAEFRQERSLNAALERAQLTQAGQNTRQQVGIDARAGMTPPGVLTAISSERQKLADTIAKEEPGALSKLLLRRGNPRQSELQDFDAALKAAKDIQRLYPQLSTEEGLEQLGVTGLSPNQTGQVEKFLLMLRGQ